MVEFMAILVGVCGGSCFMGVRSVVVSFSTFYRLAIWIGSQALYKYYSE